MKTTRSNASNWLLAGVILILFALFSSCITRSSHQKVPRNPRSIESTDLILAKEIYDNGAHIIQSFDGDNFRDIQQSLEQLFKDNPTPYLTEEESIVFQGYVEKKQAQLEPIVQKINAKFEDDLFIPGFDDECYTTCILFFLLDCRTNAKLGYCVGLWDCNDHVAMPCPDEPIPGSDDGPCKNDADCPDGYRCAKWVFKKNECVQTCETDSDCPPGQHCKKPFGTSFCRCK